MTSRRRLLVGLGLGGLGAVAWLGGRSALGVRKLAPIGAASPLPTSSFDWTPWSELLAEIVEDGFVHYERLMARPEPLEALCARLAVTGPRTDPDRFPTAADALAYHLNAYNALVLLGVLRHLPIQSVGDVRGPWEPKAHMGFFWGLRFLLDGRWRHLYGLEHDTLLRDPVDARIHAAINCASWSCPPLRATAFEPARLDAQLEEATRDWVRGHAVVSHDASRLVLHPLMDFYPHDFADHARRAGWGDRPVDFLRHWLDPEQSAALDKAVRAGAPISGPPYDWRLNEATVRNAGRT